MSVEADGTEAGMDRQPILVSDLILVRPLTEDDGEALRVIASDPLLWEQHPAKERGTPEGFRRWMADALASGGALVVVDRATDEIIGTSRYDDFDPVSRSVEIGWTFLARSHWGGRFNGELKRLMLDHVLGSLDYVRFRAHEGNIRSQTAIRKLGAEFIGTEPDPSRRGDNHAFRLDKAVWARHEKGTTPLQP